MISVSIQGGSLKRAFKDVRRTTKRKSFRRNRGLAKKISRRFRAQAKKLKLDMAKSLTRVSGLTLQQAKKRVFHSKRISGSRFRSEVYSRGQSQKIHSGVLRGLKVRRKGKGKGVYLNGRKIKGGFITRETLHGRKELRRVLIRDTRKIKALTEGKTIPRLYARSGPILLRRHTNRLLKEIGLLVKKA